MASSQQGQGGPVWSKRVGDAAVAAANVNYCAGFDVVGRPPADLRLAPFDLQTNAAHVVMLVEESIIPAEAGSAIAGGLLKLRQRDLDGENLLRPSCEDIHMSLETQLGEIIGQDNAGHLHTARSRNDQVATDMRLWLREEIIRVAASLLNLSRILAEHAETHLDTVCPGFTHGQPAMVTSWGHWVMSYLPRLLRDIRALGPLLDDLADCPLGAAASFGTGWPINRHRTAGLLGFLRPSASGADTIWARGETEGRFAFLLSGLLAHLAGIGQDLILLSTPPRDWLRLADEHVTGSSIMPQKRNPDFAEVTRARAAHGLGIAQSLAGIGTALPSGYNRDTQWTKYLAFDAIDNADGAADLFAGVFARLHVNRDAMKAACQVGFLNATDVADYIARARRLPFRQCYRLIGPAVKACESEGRLVRERVNEVLSTESIDPFNAEEWAPLENPRGLLQLRNQPGNPHPDRTRESAILLQGEIEKSYQLLVEQAGGWRESVEGLWETLHELAD